MDGKKMFAMTALVLMLASPAFCMCENDASSDYTGEYRAVNVAVFCGSMTYDSDYTGSLYIMKPGSANEQRILDFIADKMTGLKDLHDDRDTVTMGSLVNVYEFSTSGSINMIHYFNGHEVYLERISEPDLLAFFLTPNSEFGITATCDDRMTVSFMPGYYTQTLNNGVLFTYNAVQNGTLTISTDAWYSDIIYSANGYEKPDGMGTVVMVALIAFAVAVIGHMVYVVRGTKWP